MAKKIEGYVDAPIKEHHDLHTGGIAYVVHAPYVDDEVRCVTLVDHQSDKHERVFTESEVLAYEHDLIWSLSDPGKFTQRHIEDHALQHFEETVPQWVSRARAIVRAKHGLSDPS